MLVDPIANFLARFKSRQFRRVFVTRFGLLMLVTLVGRYLVWSISGPAIQGTPCTQQLQLDLQDLTKKGYKILFKLSKKPGDQPESYMMDTDGMSLLPFIDSSRYQHFSPQKREKPFTESETVWSPDGKRAVRNTFQLGIIDPVFKSVIGAQTGSVSWSPDGRYIVFPIYVREASSNQDENDATSQIFVAATQYDGACGLNNPVPQIYRNPEWILELQP